MKLKRFSLRFNLDRENDRRAWEALHRMDARSINQEIIARINAKRANRCVERVDPSDRI